MKYGFSFILLLATIFSAVYAEEFTPPDKIAFMGKTYALAYKSSSPNGRAIFEYTANNEPIENWSSLVTLLYAKSLTTSPQYWAGAFKASLDRENPRPHYKLYVKGNNGYARYIFEPSSKSSSYESNVYKSFHVEACGGLLVLQYAQKYPQGTDQSSEGKLATLKRIADENAQHAESLEESNWLPSCD